MVLWRLLKTAIFTILAPGTVALYLPQMLRDRSADLAGRFVYTDPWMALFLCGAAIYLWCAWDFVVKGLGTPAPIDAPRVLVVRGLYRLTRKSDVHRRRGDDLRPGRLLPLGFPCDLPARCLAGISHLREALRRADSPSLVR